MRRIRKILCPIDFSEASHTAVEAAVDLAQLFSAELLLLHVVQPITPLPDSELARAFDVRLYEEEVRKRVAKKLAGVDRDKVPRRVRVQSRALYGLNPAGTIADVADTEKIDLIVIATHGMSGWRHYVYGSVAQKVIQHTGCPVFLVRARKGRKQQAVNTTRDGTSKANKDRKRRKEQ